MAPKIVKLVADVESVFTVLAEEYFIRKVVAKQAYVVVGPGGDIAVFSAGVVTDHSADCLSETFEKLLKVRFPEGTMWGEILCVICEREEGIVFMRFALMDASDRPLH